MKRDCEFEATEDFKFILDKYIKQFFPTNIEFTIKYTDQKQTLKKYVKKYDNEILFYPCLNNPIIYGKINLEYTIGSIEIVEYVMEEIMKVSQYTYNNIFFSSRRIQSVNSTFNNFYSIATYDMAFQIAICRYMSKKYNDNDTISKTLLNLIFKLDAWSSKTYEGSKVPFGFIIDCNTYNPSSYDYLEFLDNHSSAVFTDGIYGGILLDKGGNFIKYFSYEDEETSSDKSELRPFSPYNYIMFTEHCSDYKIGILCLSTGDILLIKDKKLLFSKRNGNWIYYDYNRFRHIVSRYIESNIYNKNDTLTNFIDQIYLTMLDVSFSHTGGCLAITYHDRFDEYKKAIENDLLDLDLTYDYNDDIEVKKQKDKIRQRKTVIKNLVENTSTTHKEFFNINRKLRQELLGLDGATIVNTDGKLLAAGAIVSIDGGSENGGRTAATKQLAKYGFAIKISEDGFIQCYAYNENTKKVENVLNFC